MAKSKSFDSISTQSSGGNDTKSQVQSIHRKSKARTRDEALARKIVPKLASRAYHLPGYDLKRDYIQYMFNNHPLFGICFHHKLHPLKMRQRLIILCGSFAFGVAITNAIYLWFLSSGRDDKTQVFTVNLSTAQQEEAQSFYITQGLLVLVTIGSGSHAVFDRFVWSISACGCCRPGGRFESRGGCTANLGWYLTIFLVVAVFALATCIVLVRASMDEGQDTVPLVSRVGNATLTWNATKEDIAEILDFNDMGLSDYSFLKGYAVEFAVSLFVYYPLMETVFFSGLLGCFYLPFLGGRPGAMKKEEKEQSEIRHSACPTELT